MLLLIFISGTAVIGGKLSDNIVFSLSFDNGKTPEIAKGDSGNKFRKSQLQLVPGLGKDLNLGLAKGMVIGATGQALKYNATGNLYADKGTIVFWLHELPDYEQGKSHDLTVFSWEGNEQIKLSVTGKKQLAIISQGKKYKLPARLREWDFIAISWNGKKLSWYLNGNPCGSILQQQALPDKMSTSFFMLGEPEKNSKTRLILDELAIYKKPLTATEILALYAKVSGLPTEQKVSLSDTSEKIVIDGKMGPEEWRDAATILIGLNTKTKSIADTISRLYLTYDKNFLYFYLKSPIPTYALDDKQNTLLHGFFKRDTTVFDTNVDFDDALEFRIKTAKKQFWHRMLTNTIDVKYDYRFNKSRRELKWNPDWITKTTVSDEGWDLEGRIPFSVFPETPKTGTVWQMNVYRLWRKLKDQVDAWNNDNYLTFNPKDAKPGLVFFKGRNNIAVTIPELTQLNNRAIDMQVKLQNTAGTTGKVKLTITNQDNTVLLQKSLSIPAGKNETVKISKKFKTPQPTRLKFSVTGPTEKLVYWEQDFPVFNIEEATIDLIYFPIQKKIKFSGKFPQLGLDINKTEIKLALKQQEKTIWTKTIRPKKPGFDEEVKLNDLKNGTYIMEVNLLENNQVVATESSEFKIAPAPAWLGNKLGITKEVPPPWTPVEYQPDKISVWGREYIYRDGLFPAQIDAAGDALLAAPVKLDFGRNIFAGAKTKVEKISADDTQATFLRTITLPQLTVKVKTRIEFDGMMWNSLELMPKGNKYNIAKLSLDIPMATRNATLMMPHDYSLKNTGHIRKWHGSIRPLWVGNEERGLCFFTEHSYNWIVNDRQKELEIIPGSKEVLLKVNLIDHPAAISKPLKLEFGLMATPVKKMRKDQRSWRINHFTNQMTPEKNARYIQMPFRKWAKNPYYETCYPVADPKMRPVRGVRNRCKWEGLLYHQLKRSWAESPEAKMFAYEWTSEQRVVPTVDANPDNRQIEVCQGSKSFQDFLVNGLAKVQKEVDPGGFYFDVANPKKCSNLNHGCGYVVNGEVRPTFNILGAREMIKRIYIATKKIRPESIIAYHVSGQVCLPVHSFADLLFEGENFCSILHDNRGYEETLTLDTYRAEHMGHNFGPAVTLLPEFNITSKWLQNTPYAKSKRVRKDKAAAAWLKRRKAGKETKAEAEYWRELTSHINYLLGLSLLHDNPFWVAAMYNMQPVRKHYHILDKFNYAGGDNKFIPYWKQQAAKVVSPGKAVVSFYTSKGRAVAVIMNMSAKEADVKLRLDFAKLGLSGNITASGLEYKNPVILKGDLLTVKSIPSHQYRVVMLKN